MTPRRYPPQATADQRRQIDNMSDLSAYAFGFSDQKPGWSYWLVQGIVTLGAIGALLGWWGR